DPVEQVPVHWGRRGGVAPTAEQRALKASGRHERHRLRRRGVRSPPPRTAPRARRRTEAIQDVGSVRPLSRLRGPTARSFAAAPGRAPAKRALGFAPQIERQRLATERTPELRRGGLQRFAPRAAREDGAHHPPFLLLLSPPQLGTL